MQVRKLQGIFAILMGLGTAAHAAPLCSEQGGHLSCSGSSAKGATLTLSFPASSVTTDTGQAILCSSTPQDRVSRVRFYMDMGGGHRHGMEADVASRSDGCSDLEQLEFSMSGLWQAQVDFASGDHGEVDVDVQ